MKMVQAVIVAILVLGTAFLYKVYPDTFWEYFPFKFTNESGEEIFLGKPVNEMLKKSKVSNTPAPNVDNNASPTWGVTNSRVGFYQTDPSIGSGNIVGYIPEQTGVRILSANETSYEVRHNGFAVWISAGSLNIGSN